MTAHAMDESPRSVSGKRIAAMSGAIFVHVLAAGFMLLPMTIATIVRDPPDDTDVITIVPVPTVEPIPLPPVPEPPLIRRIEQTVAPPPVPVATTAPDPIVTDTPTVEPFVPPSLPTTDAPTGGGEVTTPVGGERLLEMTLASPPKYPLPELKRGIGGIVMLRILVDADGLPLKIEVAKSSGRPALDRAALGAAKKWRFKPALANGAPVESWGLVPVEFRPMTI